MISEKVFILNSNVGWLSVRDRSAEVFTGKPFCFMAGGLACFCKGDTSDVEVGARLMETGKDTLAELAGLISRAFGEENDHLAEFLIRTFGDEEGRRKMGTELALELFGLDFEPSRTDDVVATTENAETVYN